MFKKILFVLLVAALVSLGCFGGNNDADGDGIVDTSDNCIDVANPGQEDVDGDAVGDACDNCIAAYNPDQADADGNGTGDACEDCGTVDEDCDGTNDGCDSNVDLTDSDCDGEVDGCDEDTDTTDVDCDGILDNCDDDTATTDADCDGQADECVAPNLADNDCDGIVDGCDGDIDPNGCGELCSDGTPVPNDDDVISCRYASTFNSYNCTDFPSAEGWTEASVDSFCRGMQGAKGDSVVVETGNSCLVELGDVDGMDRCNAVADGKYWTAYMPAGTPAFVCGLIPGNTGLDGGGPFCSEY